VAVAEFHGRVMASHLHVIAVGSSDAEDTEVLNGAIRGAVLYLEHLEQCWSRFIPTSDVSRINQLGPDGGVVDVDPSTLTLLAAMIEGYHVTAGRFDPTVLSSMIREGYAVSITDPAAASSGTAAGGNPASLYKLQLDPAAATVVVEDGLTIDPGGIGKGLAADLAVARLIEAGVDGAMVSIGGDLAAGGTTPDPAGWIVDVEQPDPADGVLCSLAIDGGGVATSSVRSRRWVSRGIERHHQIDPLTAACSTTDLTAVTVFAPAGWLAEVHATAALAVGSDAAIGYLDGHGLSGIAVTMTASGERVWVTGDLEGVVLGVASAGR